MKCPHCRVAFHENWSLGAILFHNKHTNWIYRDLFCPECSNIIIEIHNPNGNTKDMVYPQGVSRQPIPVDVPEPIAVDYREACAVLPASAKASAALSRRCMQSILSSSGYAGRDLAKQVDAFLAETDPSKVAPESLRTVVDGIRNFGNFSAHPITETTTLQIIDVDPEEATWCLEILEDMFEHFYVKPAQAKARKAALDAKLAAAGKPPSK